MRKHAIGAIALTLAATSIIAVQPLAAADAPAVVRKVLMQQDLPMPNTTEALISVTIPVGGREGKHTHPGALMVYVQSGAIALDYEGKPQITYKAGDVFFVEAGKIHEGINMGTVPAVALATFVGPKGQPITKQVE
ncbi:MAG TPA: cupin domain-containing protein [Micropepsaceae bacterium]|nr:cupin domain-containing protein [Micropepsaceae bacterium]